MSDIRIAIKQMGQPSKVIAETLLDFYEQMKSLESDPERGGKQATCIVMAMNDLERTMHPRGMDKINDAK